MECVCCTRAHCLCTVAAYVLPVAVGRNVVLILPAATLVVFILVNVDEVLTNILLLLGLLLMYTRPSLTRIVAKLHPRRVVVVLRSIEVAPVVVVIVVT